MLTKSIRWRLQVWQGMLLICVLAGFGVTACRLYDATWFRRIDEELVKQTLAISSDVRRPPFDKQGKHDMMGPRRGGFRFPPEFEDFGPPPDADGFGPKKDRRPLDGEFNSPPPNHQGFDKKGPPFDKEAFLENREIHLSPRTLSLFDTTETNGSYYAVWSKGGQLRLSATNAPASLELPARVELDMVTHARTRGEFREVFLFTEIGECILSGRSIAMDLASMRRFAWWLAIAGAAVLAIGLGGGWIVAAKAIRPIEAIGATASRISAGSLSERIDIADTDSELGRLAGVLNSTFSRLETAFAQQQQFTADASHELRTPIAILISETQTTLARERSAAEYRETVETCLEAAQQMRRLTQSLLQLARYDAGQEAIERSVLDLAEQAAACAEFVAPLCRDRGIRIQCDLSPAPVMGDAIRLGQAISNLLTNAICYNKDNGEIRVRTAVEQEVAVLEIADTGQGISEEDMQHVFDRFYRADKSRSRPNGHSGLGLAICRAIVEAHGGSIEAASRLGEGSVFTIRLPLHRA